MGQKVAGAAAEFRDSNAREEREEICLSPVGLQDSTQKKSGESERGWAGGDGRCTVDHAALSRLVAKNVSLRADIAAKMKGSQERGAGEEEGVRGLREQKNKICTDKARRNVCTQVEDSVHDMHLGGGRGGGEGEAFSQGEKESNTRRLRTSSGLNDTQMAALQGAMSRNLRR